MEPSRLVEIRKMHHLTQVQMAKILKCGYSTYNLWENNKLTIPLDKLNEFCNYFELSMDYVVNLTNNHSEIKKTILNKEIIGENLYKIRISLKLTQEELATKLNYEQPVISRCENGKTFPSTIYLIGFVKLSGQSMDFICDRLK